MPVARVLPRLAALLATLALGCVTTEPARSEPRETSTHAATTEGGAPALTNRASHDREATPKLPPLEGEWLERLELPNGSYAFASIPVGAREKRPIVVGVHGAGDRPDWSCSEWRAVTAEWAFVVCPVGVRHPVDKQAFVWGSANAIAARADDAVAALRAKYGAWIDDGPLVYGGWSQGGTLASQVIASRPGVYDRAVLVEVGYTPLDANQVARSFLGAGIKRAVVTCASVKCRGFARDLETAGKHQTLPVRVTDVGLRGHWFDEPVFRSIGPAFAWMVEDQPRYASLGAAIEARYLTD